VKQLPTYLKCIVCGRDNHRGLNIRFLADGSVIRSEVPFNEELCGFRGVVHGGILTAVLDEAMGWAAAYNSRRMCLAAELQIRFVRPVLAGEKVQVVAEMERDRRRVIEASGRIEGTDGEILVRGFGKFMPLAPEQAREIDSYLNYDGCERGLFAY
jgi:uncharacterized protein (TIGR00369 family)